MLSDEEKKLLAERLFGGAMQNAKPLRYSKSTERVKVPQDLRDFLLGVHRRIAEKDPSATIPSDDLLQCEKAYGGLDDVGGGYSFVYFPGSGRSVRWEFTLLPSAIEEIGAGGCDEITVQRFEEQ